MFKPKGLYTILLFILTVITFSNNAYSKSKAGKIIFFSGKVLYSTNNGESWSNASINQILNEGSCIKTDSNSEAALLLTDHSQIRIKSNSIFCLKKSGSAPGILPFRTGLNKLLKGKIWFRNKRKGSKPVFETPVVTASIRGTEMVIAVNNNGNKSDVTVLEGKVKCYNNKGSVVIKRGEAAETVKGSAPHTIILARPELSAQWLIITPDIIGPTDRKFKNSKYIKLAEQAVKSLAFGNISKAKTLINKAYKLNPNSAAVNVAMATILQSQGKFQKALFYAKKAYKIDPLSIPALLRKTELLLGLNRIKDAFKLTKSFNGEDDARIHILKGYLFLIKKQLQDGINEFKQAIKLNPSLATSHLGLGLALYSSGKFKQGLVEMEKASLLDPFAAYPHNYLAKALYEHGERHEAEIELKRAMQLDPNDPTPHIYLSVILADEYRQVESVKHIQQAIKLNNNLLATRSRFLLDQDRAFKNVSLAYSLSELGLDEWASSEGDLAVWSDPTNSGAYLFRASQAVAKKEADAATQGDVMRAQLLQPVNSNTYITYNGYQSLLEIPEVKGSLWAIAGNDETINAGGLVNGGTQKVAFYSDAIYQYTDGPYGNSDRKIKQVYIKMKSSLNENHQLMLSSILGKNNQGDLNAWTFKHIQTEDVDNNLDYWNIDLGYHWRQGAGKSLLINFQGHGEDSNSDITEPLKFKFLSNIKSKYHSNTWRFELLELYRINNHRISFGGSIENKFEHPRKTYYYPLLYNIAPVSFQSRYHKQEKRIFLRDLWEYKKLFITAGISYSDLNNIWLSYNSFKEKEKLLPEIGIAYSITEKDIFRIAYFQEIQPDYLSGTLQPTEISGFKKVTGTMPGTWTRFMGIGWDRNWSENIFTRFELYRTSKRYPYLFTPYPESSNLSSWRNEKSNTVRFVINSLLTDNLALSVDLKAVGLKAENPDRKRNDYISEIRLSYVHKSGIRSQLAFWIVSQNEKNHDFGEKLGNDFIVTSFYIEKTFFNKKYKVSLTLENITDRQFNYLVPETANSTQLPWEGFLATLGFRWNF